MMKEVLSKEGSETSAEDIILGKFAIKYGIKNYCYPDWYSWPIFEIKNGFAFVLEKIEESVTNYRSLISLMDFAQNNNYDYIKQMYEAVIPKELRHGGYVKARTSDSTSAAAYDGWYKTVYLPKAVTDASGQSDSAKVSSAKNSSKEVVS